MKRKWQLLAGGILLVLALSAHAAVLYVDVNTTNPAPPYTNWSTAARDIQSAVDASATGDTVLVTNGTYATGGRAVSGIVTNRVTVDRAITVQSVNGPGVTVIQGYQLPLVRLGDGAVRCAYLTNRAVLSGFTLTNGATRDGAGAGYEEHGGGAWCESASAVLSNCVVSGNAANYMGGGVYQGTLYNCTLTANSTAIYGGGAAVSTLNECTLTDNSANSGGGAYYCTLNNCTLKSNSAVNGAGASYYSTLNYCNLTRNSASWFGGGVDNRCTLNNCLLTGNSANYGGGGATSSTLNNCTLTGNWATNSGGGAYDGTLNNCIVYYNRALIGSNYTGSALTFCCTTPLPASSTGNIEAEPQLASDSHLSAASPCRGKGSAAYASGADIDGEPWASPPSIGCDEYRPGWVIGALDVSIVVAPSNVIPVGFPAGFIALISGRTTGSAWNFGDGVAISNRPSTSHAWSVLGDYPVVLTAYNESNPGGISATVTVRVVAVPVHYVAAGGAAPAPPYTNWATAASDIQSAVDVAEPGALVLVSNGVYATGGRAVYGTMTNRVAVDRPVTVRSVNGPGATIIQGYQIPGTAIGQGAIRCVYLTSGATLSGFTLTNGATSDYGDYYREHCGGGVWCESDSALVSNCWLKANYAQYDGGGAYSGTLAYCSLTGNSNLFGGGGGASGARLNNCTLSGNSARGGGGVDSSILNNCTLSGNSASSSGGGSSACILNNCTLTGNSARSGGGVYTGTLSNCVVTSNSAYSGGGVYGGTVYNCTLTGNSASGYGGGAAYCTLNNCIVCFNDAPLPGANYLGGALNYCCTTPQPTAGTGNITLNPELASASHVSAASPCRGAGSAAYAGGTDIDGEPWGSPPSIGCDEYRPGTVTGDLSLSAVPNLTNVAVGFPVAFTGLVYGRPTASAWDFGDGVIVSNRPWTSHTWSLPGNYSVKLTAYNDSYPGGVSATVMVHVALGAHYVAVDSATPTPPYTNWATAARDIQSAVDVAEPGALVIVSNGVYAAGGRMVYGTMTNRVVIDRAILVRSVNGPAVTVIQGCQVPGSLNGDGAVRCAYLTNCATLSGFTLTGGATRASGYTDREQSGGGLWCESASAVVSNCIVEANSACSAGGGAYQGTLYNCALTGNSAASGGGASSATLNNCTLTGNSASGSAGGVASCTLNHCIVYFNTTAHSPQSEANYSGGSLNYCCTTPKAAGAGNIAVDPQLASATHISGTSPCRGAGSRSYAGGTDIDGEPWASPPSLGCDEYWPGAVTGPLNVGIVPALTNVAAGFPAGFTALISGRSTASTWNFGDGVVVSNSPSVSHAWIGLGNYPVVLTAYNESNSDGVSATVTVQVVTTPVHYVAAGNATPIPPYTNWATAASDIQSAVDVAGLGALVLVNDGVYATGGRAVYGTMTNRVAIDRAITVQSLNGPAVTVIRGAWAPGATNGDGAVRCVYLTNGAALAGFTLTNGATRTIGDASHERCGGGLWCEAASAVASNCVVTGNSASAYGGGVYGGTLNTCTLMANWATQNLGMGMGGQGGGAYSATLNNCLLANNVAWYGGAVYYGTLNNCVLTNNSATNGGGAYSSMLNNCSLVGNLAPNGGGAYYGTLNNCTLATNRASSSGGGAYSSTLNYCTLTGNSANGAGSAGGGGAYSAVLNNCSLVANSASNGGGANAGMLNNCALSGNSAFNGGGAYSATLNDCTLTNNWADFGGGAYSGTLSNCILAGNFTVVHCEGCGEGAGACRATLNNCTLVGNRGGIGGGASRSILNNCKVIGNSGGSGGGVYLPEGMNNCTVISNSAYACGGVLIGGAMIPPQLSNSIIYFNTSTVGGANYAFQPYGGLQYCCTIPQPPSGVGNITNAPAFVDLAGGNLRLQTNSPCINAGNNAYAQGGTDLDGRPRIVSGTVDIGAYEFQPGTSGLFLGWLQQYGLPTDGSADYAQSDQDGMNNWLEFCTGTNPTNSLSALRLVSVTRNGSSLTVTWQSVTNQTYFLERSIGLSRYPSFLTLATNLPGQWATTTYTDTNAAGRGPFFYRVGVQPAGWQMPSGGSIISYAWLQQYGLLTDGSADHADPDHDGSNNWQEWRAATDPTNATSALRMLLATGTGSDVTVSWSSVTGRSYSLERATEMGAAPDFSLLRSNIAGLAGATSFTDTNAVGATPRFYRVRVQQ